MLFISSEVISKWASTIPRHRFFITYSVFYCIFFLILSISQIYQVYGLGEIHTLLMFVLWNFYVLSLQYAYGKSNNIEISLPRINDHSISGAEVEVGYINNRSEGENSKNEGVLSQIDEWKEDVNLGFDSANQHKKDSIVDRTVRIAPNELNEPTIKSFENTNGMKIEKKHDVSWQEQNYWKDLEENGNDQEGNEHILNEAENNGFHFENQ